MDDESHLSQDLTEHESREPFLQDFLDGRGAESPHQVAQELEALFTELGSQIAVDNDETARHTLVENLRLDAAREGHTLEMAIQQWVQVFLADWN